MTCRRCHHRDAGAHGVRARAVLSSRDVSPRSQPCAPSFQPSLHRPSRTDLSGSGTCRSLNRHKPPYAPSTGRCNWTRPATARLLQSPGRSSPATRPVSAAMRERELSPESRSGACSARFAAAQRRHEETVADIRGMRASAARRRRTPGLVQGRRSGPTLETAPFRMGRRTHTKVA
jgi:hypothetical protein